MRRRGFANRLARNGREASVFGAEPEGRSLTEWLQGLPKPAGVMNASNPIRVQDVVEHLGVSRRLAEMRFRRLQGRTIHEEIESCRLEEVAKQILTTRLSMRKIATSCGFRSVSHLGVLFRRRYGTTLLGWRREHGAF